MDNETHREWSGHGHGSFMAVVLSWCLRKSRRKNVNHAQFSELKASGGPWHLRANLSVTVFVGFVCF